MSDFATERIESFDGTGLAVHRMGEGRPVLLLHGLFSSAWMNWIDFGHARALVDGGLEAIMPDTRSHGASEKPHNASAYPRDVLARDVEAIVKALGLEDFDLVGYSLGARTAARCVIEGALPRRLVLAGMGLQGLAGWKERGAFFMDAIDRFDAIRPGDRAYFAVQFMKRMRVDRKAAKLLLHAVDDVEREELAAITMPTLVVCGDKDRDNGSPQKLVDALPNARLEQVPGTHMSSVLRPELGKAITRFLTA